MNKLTAVVVAFCLACLLSSLGWTQTAEPDNAENLSQAAAEAQSMEDVRQRHLPDLLKIPHVVNMGIELKGSETIFNVQVDKEENVPQVERMVPSEIEGYDVEVEAVPTGPAVGY